MQVLTFKAQTALSPAIKRLTLYSPRFCVHPTLCRNWRCCNAEALRPFIKFIGGWWCDYIILIIHSLPQHTPPYRDHSCGWTIFLRVQTWEGPCGLSSCLFFSARYSRVPLLSRFLSPFLLASKLLLLLISGTCLVLNLSCYSLCPSTHPKGQSFPLTARVLSIHFILGSETASFSASLTAESCSWPPCTFTLYHLWGFLLPSTDWLRLLNLCRTVLGKLHRSELSSALCWVMASSEGSGL